MADLCLLKWPLKTLKYSSRTTGSAERLGPPLFFGVWGFGFACHWQFPVAGSSTLTGLQVFCLRMDSTEAAGGVTKKPVTHSLLVMLSFALSHCSSKAIITSYPPSGHLLPVILLSASRLKQVFLTRFRELYLAFRCFCFIHVKHQSKKNCRHPKICGMVKIKCYLYSWLTRITVSLCKCLMQKGRDGKVCRAKGKALIICICTDPVRMRRVFGLSWLLKVAERLHLKVGTGVSCSSLDAHMATSRNIMTV